jgi:uncharacterized membrane protein YcaP (DUF421 family)
MQTSGALFFGGWEPIVRVLVIAPCAYVFLLFTLRAAGSRALVKTNVFDFIIIVGVGSAFGRMLTAKDVALAEACTALLVLVLLQYAVSALRLRSRSFARLVDADATLLYYDARFLHRNTRKARLTESDLREAARAKGVGSMSDVAAIVLEAGGELSVIRKAPGDSELVTDLHQRRPAS